MPYRSSLLLALVLVVVVGLSPAWGQTDVEPNNTCQTAQAFDLASLPFSLTGNLEGPVPPGDVDFYRFTAPPGQVVIVDLEGARTGQGTLVDPFLGLFSSGCQLVEVDDDGGVSLNSRLGFRVPANGVFILAVTSCCNSAFTGSSATGTYRLSVVAGGAIAGSVRDGVGRPVTGTVAAFTSDGEFAAETVPDCCAGNASTYELIVPPGTYRVLAEGLGVRTWYTNRPNFQQADDIIVPPGAQITGADLTLNGFVQFTPRINQRTFTAGQTMRVDLELLNPSSSSATVVLSSMAFVPAEPGVSGFFVDRVPALQATTRTLAPGHDEVLENVVVYTFTGGEQPGGYEACTTVIQNAITIESCAFSEFEGGSDGAPPDGQAGHRAPRSLKPVKKKP